MDSFVNNGQFKKGQTSWLKGTKGLIVNPLKGKKMSKEWKEKLKKPKSKTDKYKWTEDRKKEWSKRLVGKRMGEESPRWKGGKSVRPNHLRRKRIKENGGSHTQGEWELLKIQYNNTCPSCKKSEPKIKLTKDHIVSISKGGSDNIENIQPLCQRCNSKKFSKCIKF